MIVEQRSRPKRGYVLLFVAICLFVLSTSTAFATDRIVTKTADTNDTVCDADCSLREAIVAANASGGTDRVILGTGQTYNLSLGALPVTAGVTIDGHGSTINRQGLTLDRVLNIQGPFAVTINDLTITGGVATGPLSLGGGIRIAGGGANVILNNCIVNGNSTAVESGASDDRGGIAGLGSHDAAGGVATLAALTLNNSSVTGNTGFNGGGNLCGLGALTGTQSTISGKTASGGERGGIDMVGNASTLSVNGSTLAAHTVTGPLPQGGALSVPSATSPPPPSHALGPRRMAP